MVFTIIAQPNTWCNLSLSGKAHVEYAPDARGPPRALFSLAPRHTVGWEGRFARIKGEKRPQRLHSLREQVVGSPATLPPVARPARQGWGERSAPDDGSGGAEGVTLQPMRADPGAAWGMFKQLFVQWILSFTLYSVRNNQHESASEVLAPVQRIVSPPALCCGSGRAPRGDPGGVCTE